VKNGVGAIEPEKIGVCWIWRFDVRAGNEPPDSASTVSPLLPVAGLPVATVIPLADEEPATGVISTSGRVISGSGLDAPPGFSWWISALIARELKTPISQKQLKIAHQCYNQQEAQLMLTTGSTRL